MRLDATSLRCVLLCAWAAASCSATGNGFFDGSVDGSVSQDVAKSDAPVSDATVTDAPAFDAPVSDVPTSDVPPGVDVLPQPDAPMRADGAVAGPLSPVCLGCISTGCASAGADCLGDAVCVRCVNVDRGDPACATNLAWRRMQSCACSACPGTCSTECVGVDAGPPLDAPTPTDRVTVLDTPAPTDTGRPVDAGPTPGACVSCGSTRCVAAGGACLSDPDCAVCLMSNYRDPRCATNATWQRVAECTCPACPSECAAVCAGYDAGAPADVPTIPDVPTVTDVPTGVSAACTSCGTTRCLSQGVACLGDTVCSRCASSNFRDSACMTNTRFQQLLTCACVTCGADCGDVCAAIPH